MELRRQTGGDIATWNKYQQAQKEIGDTASWLSEADQHLRYASGGPVMEQGANFLGPIENATRAMVKAEVQASAAMEVLARPGHASLEGASTASRLLGESLPSMTTAESLAGKLTANWRFSHSSGEEGPFTRFYTVGYDGPMSQTQRSLDQAAGKVTSASNVIRDASAAIRPTYELTGAGKAAIGVGVAVVAGATIAGAAALMNRD